VQKVIVIIFHFLSLEWA